jgi:hypothetical protein
MNEIGVLQQAMSWNIVIFHEILLDFIIFCNFWFNLVKVQKIYAKLTCKIH